MLPTPSVLNAFLIWLMLLFRHQSKLEFVNCQFQNLLYRKMTQYLSYINDMTFCGAARFYYQLIYLVHKAWAPHIFRHGLHLSEWTQFVNVPVLQLVRRRMAVPLMRQSLEIDCKSMEPHLRLIELFYFRKQKTNYKYARKSIILFAWRTHVSKSYSVCDTVLITIILDSLHNSAILSSRTLPNGSGSSSNVKQVVPHCLNNFGRASAGWPRITNNREFSLRKFWSKSSRHCKRNLEKYESATRFLLYETHSTPCQFIVWLFISVPLLTFKLSNLTLQNTGIKTRNNIIN